MRFSILASMAVALACSLGCDRKPDPKVNVDKEINVDAPGIKVNVDPDRGVSVQAPGVDVETSPSGVKVDVAPDRAK